jgi:hypothetical protein
MADGYVVYWLWQDGQINPRTDGYVGITKKFNSHVIGHRKNERFPEGFGARILFIGKRSECLEVERAFRPIPRIGWNNASGGNHAPMHSEETRRKIGAAGVGKKYCLGHKLTEEHKAKISRAIRGRKHSEEARAKMRIVQAEVSKQIRIGKKHSAAHRAAISAGGMGKHPMSPEHKEKVSLAQRTRKRAPLSKEHKAKIGAKSLGRAHTVEAKEKMRAAGFIREAKFRLERMNKNG